MLLALLIVMYAIPLAILIGAAALLFRVSISLFHAGIGTAIAISAAVSILSLPVIVSGHGIGVYPLVVRFIEGRGELRPWSFVVAPVTGWFTYVILRRILRGRERDA